MNCRRSLLLKRGVSLAQPSANTYPTPLQPLRTIAEANAHRGAAFYGPYANGFRQDGSQCVIYRMSITGKKAEQLLEDVLRESAGFEWMLQVWRLSFFLVGRGEAVVQTCLSACCALCAHEQGLSNCC